jgi:DNA-binding transcriptional regulator YdaS (Cro superfamily)
MNLKTYISVGYGKAMELASELGIHPSYLSQMINGDRAISPERCVAIEKATNGAVTRKDLRPNDFWKIWPDLSKDSV